MNSSFFLRYIARFIASQMQQPVLWALYNANEMQFRKWINKILFDLASEGLAACQVNYTNDMELPYLQGFNEVGFPLGFGNLPDNTPTNYTTSFSYYPPRNMVNIGKMQDQIFWGFAFFVLLTGGAATGIKFLLNRNKPLIAALEKEIADLEDAVANSTIDDTIEERITANIIQLFSRVLPKFHQDSKALNELGLMDCVSHEFIGLDPVVFPDGHSVSRTTFNQLIAGSQDQSIHSPQTNISYAIDTVKPNALLRYIATTLAKDYLLPQDQIAISALEQKRKKLDAYTLSTIWNKLLQFTYLGGISAFILLMDTIAIWNLPAALIRERGLSEFEQNCCNALLNMTGLIPYGPQAFFNSGNESGVLAGQCSATENDITVCNPQYFSLPENSLSAYCSLPSSEYFSTPIVGIAILFSLVLAQLFYLYVMYYLHLWLDEKDTADMLKLPIVEPEERQLLPSPERDEVEEIIILEENEESIQEAGEHNMVPEKTEFITSLCNPKTSIGKKAREYLNSNKEVTILDSNTKDYASNGFFKYVRELKKLPESASGLAPGMG